MKLENVIAITQWGRGDGATPVTQYILTLDANTLAGKTRIFKRTPKRRSGYQRTLAPARLGKGKTGVAGYLLSQMGIFPTSVLVNVRKNDGRLSFKRKYSLGEHMEIGDLEVPDDVIWYTLDGQHRIEGLKAARNEAPEFKDYPLTVTMTNEDLFYEMMIFYMVNSRQKNVPTDLVYRILQQAVYGPSSPQWAQDVMGSGADKRKAIAATVVDFLNQKDSSPFKERIQEVGEVRTTEHLVKDGQMIRYVAIVLKERVFGGMLDEDVADLLAGYWSAVKQLYPNCFETDKATFEQYLLLKTLGLSSLHRLFPTIYGYCARDGDVSRKNMERYLSYLLEETPSHPDIDFRGPIDEDWWHEAEGPGLVHGTGEGHYQMVYEDLAHKIAMVERGKKGSK